MNAQRLLALYDRVADSPDAISRLRRFVLDLAVRGGLVEQDAADEPASALLKQIAAEKARLVSAKEIKTQKSLPKVAYHEVSSDIPGSWSWARLSEIAVCLDYMRQPINGAERAKRIKGKNREELTPYYGATQQQGWIDGFLFNEELVLLGEDGVPFFDPLRAKAYLISGKSWVNNHAHVFRGISVSQAYLVQVLNVFDYTGRVVGATRTKLNQARAVDIPIPLPPLAEQQRIVAKVDELFALCDQLEETRGRREETRDRLTQASHARLSVPDTNDEAFRANARFAINVLPQLSARADQVKHLRQTILNLAVRGKLVDQDPAEEPASELLARIAVSKTALKRKTGDRRIKSTPNPHRHDFPAALPPTWGLQSFENLFLFIDYRGRTPPKTNGGIPLITAKNVRHGFLNREPFEFVHASTYTDWMTRGLPQLDDLFFTTEAPVGNVCLNDIDEPFALAQRVICLRPYGDIDTRYFMFAIMSDVVQSLIGERSTGLTAKGIKAAKLKPLPLPVPPIEEQHRIATRLDQFMILCGKLEAALKLASNGRGRLLKSVLRDVLYPLEPKFTSPSRALPLAKP